MNIANKRAMKEQSVDTLKTIEKLKLEVLEISDKLDILNSRCNKCIEIYADALRVEANNETN